ncbi:hypothetical protein [Sphingobium fuliginis]|uniref:Uncharacterized protein n=1 Tax=Sphingobium fuliginis ATCC 27551 TaxID=1208342 RepID=A0A5B8CCD1_SPHSA|nr:hypothetical protein [Sphingobium fuliginis]QDC36465.1 hypothetical protein FIL70_03610 [Sphingobium fuliginis ATCC 27551]
MITETLIADEIWAEAPADPNEAFLFIVLAARARLDSVEHDDQARSKYDLLQWRRQYIYELCAVAAELGIGGLPSAKDSVNTPEAMAKFDADMALVLTKIKASQRALLRSDSVKLPLVTKQGIRDDLEALRARVNSSNLSEEKKAALHKKIDAVEAELDNSRSSLRPLWLLAGAVAAAVPGAVGTLADLSPAIDTVNKIVARAHEAKAHEEGAADYYHIPRLGHEPSILIADQRTTST